ncbi:hypothetical protein CTA2_2273 [Colletotrichum tanaceti]|nr:hypothetical protein CTA2_2273 [Colletotrichum tanaceti]
MTRRICGLRGFPSRISKRADPNWPSRKEKPKTWACMYSLFGQDAGRRTQCVLSGFVTLPGCPASLLHQP